jgi:hypothetical protein
MSPSEQEPRLRSISRANPGVLTCPACGGPLKADAKWCPACNFTGGDSMAMFSESPPPLLPILDAAGLLKEEDIRKIESARETLRRRFPQFQWRVCTVSLPQDTSLPLFGFWLLNACPLHASESADERAWTILLLINADSGQAAAVPGYAAEPFLSDDEWKSIISSMAEPWQARQPAEAIVSFFNNTRRQLDFAWKRYGALRPHRN